MTDTSASVTASDAPFRFLDALAATRADVGGTSGQLGVTEFWAPPAIRSTPRERVR